MNYIEHFDQIASLLKTHKNIWFNEVIQSYPEVINYYKREWIDQLAKLDDKALWALDCQSDLSQVPSGTFRDELEKVSKLSEIKKREVGDLGDLCDRAFNKVKLKKRHEILTLAKILEEIQRDHPFSHLVDIGGGVGHLARIMAHYKGVECISLDINSEFQEFGKQRLEKYPKPDDAKEVTFITHDFSCNLTSSETKEIFTKDSFSLGLHTCGPLANRHLDVVLKNDTRGLINFGCCYNRLDVNEDTNISQKAKNNALLLSPYSLTLACRGHDGMDFKDFLHKKKVKSYRYGLQLLLMDKFSEKELIPVGDAHHSLYQESFSTYVLNRLAGIEYSHKLSASEIEDFYKLTKTSKILEELFLINIIRWRFGRLLEVYILLDRVLYLQEQGRTPELFQLFDLSLSPRNIAILCK